MRAGGREREKERPPFSVCFASVRLFCGRTLVVGDGGTGKSVLTKQLLAEVAQMEATGTGVSRFGSFGIMSSWLQ